MRRIRNIFLSQISLSYSVNMRFGTFTLVANLLSIAQANRILFYETNTCSAGEYSGCYDVGSGTCCTTSAENEAAAISITKAPLDFATMWHGGGCTTQDCVRALIPTVKASLTDAFRVLVAKERLAASGMVPIPLLGDCSIRCHPQSAMTPSLP